MALEEGAAADCVLLAQITVTSLLDDEGDQAIQIAYSADLGISQALGLLEFAKDNLLRAYHRNLGDD